MVETCHRIMARDKRTTGLFLGGGPMSTNNLSRRLAYSIRQLHDTPRIASLLRRWGATHYRLGIETWHYEVFANAFLDSLASELGCRFTNKLRVAWMTVLRYAIEELKLGYSLGLPIPAGNQ